MTATRFGRVDRSGGGVLPGDTARAIVLEQVTACLGGRKVLQDVSLAIPAGAITAVVGRSGAGKTTLIRTLNGLVRPCSGTVQVDGIGTLTGAEAWRTHRRRTATVFQDHALIGRLSAIDNVLLGLADQRHPLSLLPWPRALRQRAATALESVGLLAWADAPVCKLSGGERQRVGLARALVRDPALLLADEPFASVDPALVGQLSRDFRAAVRQCGLTVVIVLHQLDTALSIADRIIGLVDGRVAFDGIPCAFDSAARGRVFHKLRALSPLPKDKP
jgi:phosphonate transport system ATP-binding protein